MDTSPLPDEATASLTLYTTDGSSGDLALSLLVEPDEAWDTGSPHPRGGTYRTTGVSFRSRLPRDRSPADHLADVLVRVGPLREALERHREAGGTVLLKLAVFADTDNPEFTLPARIAGQVAALGIDLDLDIYDV